MDAGYRKDDDEDVYDGDIATGSEDNPDDLCGSAPWGLVERGGGGPDTSGECKHQDGGEEKYHQGPEIHDYYLVDDVDVLLC